VDDVEQLLWESLTGRVAVAPDSDDLLPRLRGAARRREHRRRVATLAVTVSCAVVAVIGVPAVLLSGVFGGGSRPIVAGDAVPGPAGSDSAGSESASNVPKAGQDRIVVQLRQGGPNLTGFPFAATVPLAGFGTPRVVLAAGRPQLEYRQGKAGYQLTVTTADGPPATDPPASGVPTVGQVHGRSATYVGALAGQPTLWSLTWQEHDGTSVRIVGSGKVDRSALFDYADGLTAGATDVVVPFTFGYSPTNLKVSLSAVDDDLLFPTPATSSGTLVVNLEASQLRVDTKGCPAATDGCAWGRPTVSPCVLAATRGTSIVVRSPPWSSGGRPAELPAGHPGNPGSRPRGRLNRPPAAGETPPATWCRAAIMDASPTGVGYGRRLRRLLEVAGTTTMTGGDITGAPRRQDDRPTRLLIVDDDIRLARALTAALRRRGYDVEHARTAADAITDQVVDLVLLDLGLPDADGLELCRQLRRRGDVGIIIVTGRAEQRDRVIGLGAGADDYIVKPFGLLELTARLQAVLRRYRPLPDGTLTAGPLRVDTDRHLVTIGDDPVDLTRKEFQLLAALARTPGTVVPRERLVAEVWQTAWLGKSRTVDVHIATLRAKLGEAVTVENIRGVGYRLVALDGGNLHGR
jgi:DNA-binding response OmpR family regulator